MLVVLGAVPRESETTGDTLVSISIIIDDPKSVYTSITRAAVHNITTSIHKNITIEIPCNKLHSLIC